MKRFDNIPLHINILTIFIVLVSILSGTTLFYTLRLNSEAALGQADRLLDALGNKVFERTSRVYDPAFLLADEATLLPDLSTKPDLYGHPSGPLLMKIVSSDPNILSAYMGYEDGDFYIISHIANAGDKAKKNLGAPKDAHYNVQHILRRKDGRRVRISKFLGNDLRIMASRIEKEVAYDPRVRPWYTKSWGTDKTVLTDLYVYTFSKEVGLTAARRFDGKVSGVFGVDLSLAGISRFLAQQEVGPDSTIFIFKKDGRLIAHPDETKVVKSVTKDQATLVESAFITDLQDPVMDAYQKAFNEWHGSPFRRKIFKVDGVEYIARATVMPQKYGEDQFLGVIVPLEEFTGPIMRAGREIFLVSLGILLLFIPVIIYISRRISHPLRQLVAEAEKIQGFELDDPVEVPSRIQEIKNLGQAMGAMKATLGSFGRYVPKALVRRIMSQNITPKLGGHRRELTLLFTDIADFTTLSEDMQAEDLAHKVSEYFDNMGHIIHEDGGTIDKYIGDAIMAFWNAPTEDLDHPAKACAAALRCQHRNKVLNEQWRAQGEAPLHTRFGLHTAEAMVGNIGSSDRMDYTAMGAAVNLASRIEGLNKHFGTEILASQSVADRCSDRYLFRTVGRVIPKGASTPVTIFELKGLITGSYTADICMADDAMMDYCVRWEKAFAQYQNRKWDEAAQSFAGLMAENGGDPVASVYLKRSKAYHDNPPGADWDGTEILLTK